MALNHKAIAVEGVGFGHKALSVLGFRWFTVDYIPPVVIESYGGGGGVSSPAKLVISVFVNGKWKRTEYIVTNFVPSIEFIIKQIQSFKMSVKYIGSAINKVFAKASINTIEPVQPSFKVEPSKVEFKVRRKK